MNASGERTMRRYWDANAVVGQMGVPRGWVARTHVDLEAYMRGWGIEACIVYHAAAREYDAAYGNRKLIEELGESDRLFPCWVLTPILDDPRFSPSRLQEELERAGIRGVRLFPSQDEHHFDLNGDDVRRLLEAVRALGLPVFVEGRPSFSPTWDRIPWDQIDRFAESHPDLKIVLSAVSYRSVRHLFPLIQKHNNLFAELNGFQVHGGIEAIHQNGLSERFVLGSGMPAYSPSAAIGMIAYAEVPEDVKEKLAWRNLYGLLKGGGGR